MEVSLITIICIEGYMPQMNAQMCSLIGVIKIYFVAQKSKKKMQQEMNLFLTTKMHCGLSFIEKRFFKVIFLHQLCTCCFFVVFFYLFVAVVVLLCWATRRFKKNGKRICRGKRY